jgi:hypothetical protein
MSENHGEPSASNSKIVKESQLLIFVPADFTLLKLVGSCLYADALNLRPFAA